MTITKHAGIKSQTPQSRFYAVVVAGLLIPAFPLSALAAGIAAVSGSGTTVNTQNGVPVVAIATPSAGGLSHNRYTDFNVGAQGAVLNNALTAGTSQLAGQVGANVNLQGRNASVILNEVVSANPSQLLGQQEVFGQRAELVLANPNGISCNGCGFINVSQATLAVATPTVEGGILKSLQTSKVDATLQVDGVVSATGTDMLRLIAPSARIGGNVKGGQQVSMVLGNNTVDAASGQVTAGTALVNTDRRYDSTLFGAMQAGRISLLSTAAGVGVNLDAAQLNATDIDLTADQLTVRGKVSDSTAKDYHSHSNWWNWGRAGREYLDIDETDKRQSMARSQLNACGTLSVNANDSLNINAADLNGTDVTLAGKNVNLNTQATTDSYRYYYRDAINWWSYQKTESRDTTTQHGARINASGQLNLDAVQNASLTGAQLVSTQGNIRFNVGNDLLLNAAVNRDLRSYYENEANNTIINNSTTTNNYDNRSLLASRVDANKNLALGAGQDLTLNAARLKSGSDSLLSASGALKVDAQSYQTSQAASAVYSNTGGLFGGSDTGSGDSKTLYQGSDLQAGGKAYLTADGDVRVRGSRVKAATGVYAYSRTGGIGIDVATGQTLAQTSGSTQTVFGITTSSGSTQTQQQIITGSDLHSEADIQLISATDTAIIGSLLKAAGDIGITAAGGLTIANSTGQATTATTGSVTSGYTTGATTDTQAQGSVGIQTVTTTDTTVTGEVTGSSLQSGGSTTLSAEQTVAITGSSVESGGTTSVSGADVTIAAAANTSTTQSTTTTSSGGLTGIASTGSVGVGVEAGGSTTTATSSTSTAVTSTVEADSITVSTSGNLTLEGTQLNATGDVNLSAGTLTADVAQTQTASQSSTTAGNGTLGVSVNTSATVTVGATVAVTTTDSSQSQTTQQGAGISGDNVTVTVAGDTSLTGTQIQSQGDTQLSSGGTTLIVAATNTQSSASSTEGGSGSVSVSGQPGISPLLQPTFTVTDVSVGGSYQTGQSSSLDTQAVNSTITSGGDLQISTGGDLVATGTVSVTGDASLSAGGDLVLATTADTTYTRSETEAASATVGVSLNGGDLQSLSADLGLQATSDDQRSTTVSGGTVSAGGTLNFSGGGDTTLNATQVQAEALTLSTGGEMVLQDAQSTTTLNTSSTDAELNVIVPLQADIGLMAGAVTAIAGSGVSVELSQNGDSTPVTGTIVIQ